eukprot:3969559-Karenia_brevis.AAC.1
MVLSSLVKDIRAAELAFDRCDNNDERIRVLRMIQWKRTCIIGIFKSGSHTINRSWRVNVQRYLSSR